MTLEKVKELMQTRMDYFEQHLSMLHWVIAAIRNSSLLTGRKLCGTSSLTRCRPRNRCG